MAAKALPPQAVLAQLFDYDPVTGILTWRERPVGMFTDKKQPAAWNAKIWNSKNAGKPATSRTSNGYRGTSIWRNRFLAHRIIWKLVHGDEPQEVDHVNGDRSDNRLENLRNVPHVLNNRNNRRSKNNTSGATGVAWDESRKKWHARMSVSYRTRHIGSFDRFDDAVAARQAAQVKFGFHDNHGQR